MASEILIILFILIIILLFAYRQSAETYTEPVREQMPPPPPNYTGRIRFNDLRHERHYNKDTGSIVLEQLAPA